MDVAGGMLGALGWWIEAGVDVIVDEAPRDWLRPAPKTPETAAPPVAFGQPAREAPPAPEALPATIAAMHARLAEPGLIADAVTAPLMPTGSIASGLMLLADMPEAEDGLAGELLTGAAGRLLDRMLGAIGRDRASAYVATLAPARPAGGRISPAIAGDLAALARQHVALVAPRMLLLLGDAPARAVLGMGLAEARGRIHDLNHRGVTVPVLATFAPRQLLRELGAKAKAWQDLRLLLEGMTR